MDKRTLLKSACQKLGRNCASSLGWAEKYKGNPQAFFEHMRQAQGETLSMDEKQRVIAVVTPERPYETILGKPVEVALEESLLRGSKRRVFEIRVV